MWGIRPQPSVALALEVQAGEAIVLERSEPRGRLRCGRLDAVAVIPALLVSGGLAAAGGGYFPTAWGWSAIGLLWLAALALLVRSHVALGPLELTLLGSLAGLGVWTFVSTTWSSDASRSLLEGGRALTYLAAAAAALLVTGRGSIGHLLGGLLCGITLVSAYGLATRLFPDRLGSYDSTAAYRLAEPLGYWNALGVFTALGTVLALGFVSRGKPVRRALAAAALVVLLPTLFFTFSRGAWIALALGLAAAIALDPRRLRAITAALAVAPAPALAVWLGSRSPALTRQESSLAEAARAGHRLALATVGLAAAAAVLALLLAYAEKRLRVRPWLPRAYAAVLAVAALALVVGLFARHGSPPTLAKNGYEAFTSPPAWNGVDLSGRLFSFSGNGRADLWSAAWNDARAHPWLGSGAGSYERYWLQHRSTGLKVRDAHSLYLETLAELGPLGLTLLLSAFGAVLAAGLRARRHPLAPAAFGAFVVYLVHAGVDWDWEMTAVTATALCCGAALLIAARKRRKARMISARVRIGAVASTVALAGVALVGLLGASALAASVDAGRAANWKKAEAEARTAMRWAAWSPEPWRRLGEAQLAQGRSAAARSSLLRAIEQDRNDWSLWLVLARASDGRERREALAQAGRLNPLSPEIAEFRAELDFELPIAVMAAERKR